MSKPTTLRASRTTIVLNKVKTFFSCLLYTSKNSTASKPNTA